MHYFSFIMIATIIEQQLKGTNKAYVRNKICNIDPYIRFQS